MFLSYMGMVAILVKRPFEQTFIPQLPRGCLCNKLKLALVSDKKSFEDGGRMDNSLAIL